MVLRPSYVLLQGGRGSRGLVALQRSSQRLRAGGFQLRYVPSQIVAGSGCRHRRACVTALSQGSDDQICSISGQQGSSTVPATPVDSGTACQQPSMTLRVPAVMLGMAVVAGTMMAWSGRATAMQPPVATGTCTLRSGSRSGLLARQQGSPQQPAISHASMATASITATAGTSGFMGINSDEVVKDAQYQLMKCLSLPMIGKIALLLLCAVPVTLLGATIYAKRTNSEWEFSIWRTYCVIADVMDMEEKAASLETRILLPMIHMFGVFTFASLIGIMANDASDSMTTLQKGNFALREKQHTLLLGWNQLTIPMLKQIMEAQQERQDSFLLPIVILADRDKEEMDGQLADELGSNVLNKSIITRSGNPLKISDMERVAAGKASTVVVMSHSDSADAADLSNESGVAVVLANLRTMRADSNNSGQSIIIEMSGVTDLDDSATSVILRGMNKEGESSVSLVPGLHNLNDFMAQSAMQPGLGKVLQEISTQSADGTEFYLKRCPELDGREFGEARRMFESATLCGVVDKVTGLHLLNPGDDYVMSANDLALLLAADSKHLTLLKTVPERQPALRVVSKVKGGSPRNIVLVSFTEDVADLVAQLQSYAPKGSSITVLMPADGPRVSTSGTGGPARVHFTTGDLSSTGALVKAGVCTADSVIINGRKDVSDVVADAQIMSTVMQLQGALLRGGRETALRTRPLGVVCCMADPDAVATLRQVVELPGAARIELDTIPHRQIQGGMLTQIGAEPLLEPVFADLFGSEGQEVQLRSMARYGLPSGEYAWSQLQDLAQVRGDLLIGYLEDKATNPTLAVSPTATVKLMQADTLVVIGDSM